MPRVLFRGLNRRLEVRHTIFHAVVDGICTMNLNRMYPYCKRQRQVRNVSEKKIFLFLTSYGVALIYQNAKFDVAISQALLRNPQALPSNFQDV